MTSASTDSSSLPSRLNNVVLVGLMGSGKSTVGRLVAQSIGYQFIDTDEWIVKTTGKTIPEIFASEGESAFRRYETQALLHLKQSQNSVIATGGGIVTQAENIPLLRSLGYVIWLHATAKTLIQRTSHSEDRPLLKQGSAAETLIRLSEQRAPLYLEVCDLKIITDDLCIQDVAYGLSESIRVEFSKQKHKSATFVLGNR